MNMKSFGCLLSTVMCGAILGACGGEGGGSADIGNSVIAGNSVVTVVKQSAPADICPNGGIQVEAGIDKNGNGILDLDEITSTQYVCHGTNGGNGLTTLVSVTDEGAGAGCANGGKKVNVGLDANGNGVLDPPEITSSDYICSGADGETGASGLNPQLEITMEPAGTNCAFGGLKIASGLDADGNGILDPEEIATTNYLCNSTAGSGRNVYLTGPGLDLQLLGVEIMSDGRVAATFRITDGNGVPLDLAGLYTEGAVKAEFVVAWLDGESADSSPRYNTYTKETVTSPLTGMMAAQPVTDGDGIFGEVGTASGTYMYTFGTTLPIQHPDRTHTIAAYAVRTFQGKRYVANAIHDFSPSGGHLPDRDASLYASCMKCHGTIRAHAGHWRNVNTCNVCHTPQFTDPDTGNSIDFRVMVHKIHRGKDLPSVAAGGFYQIIGNSQAVHDYSTVKYPQEIERCTSCHASDAWKTGPSRAACGSCHDLISFASLPPVGMTLHTGGIQEDDLGCTGCHAPSGGTSGITDRHMIPATDPASPVIELAILAVAETAPGQAPVIDFTVTVNGAPRDILSNPLSAIRAVIAGPTTDYSTFWQSIVQGGSTAGTLAALDASAGEFRYTFPASAAIPPDAKGSYAIGLEAYITASSTRFAALSPVRFFAVTDTVPVARRTVVSDAACNACHADLAYHGGGGTRKGVQYCVLCHNPYLANDGNVARLEGTRVTASSMDFKVMIHKIHRGEALSQQPYLIYTLPGPFVGNPFGTPKDYGMGRFPHDLRSCTVCHLPGTFELPLRTGLWPSIENEYVCIEDPAADANDYCNSREITAVRTLLPTAAACTSCHDAPETVAHAEIMTTKSNVETCATCHAAGSANGIDTAHVPLP